MALFSRGPTNWKYILILMIFTIFVGMVILSYGRQTMKDIVSVKEHLEEISNP